IRMSEGAIMRLILLSVALSSAVIAQQASQPSLSARPAAAEPAQSRMVTIPSGTHMPVVLRNAISTKGSHVGDQVYAQTTFPVVLNDHILIPPGTYVQGKISYIKPAGRLKGSAEVLMHFT